MVGAFNEKKEVLYEIVVAHKKLNTMYNLVKQV